MDPYGSASVLRQVFGESAIAQGQVALGVDRTSMFKSTVQAITPIRPEAGDD